MKTPSKIGPWTQLSSTPVYQNPWIHVREDKVLTPAGTEGIYGVVEFQNNALGVVPLFEDGTILLVGQHRYPHDEYSWEIPEGGGRLGEDLLLGIQRELKEETGYTAQKWTPLAEQIQLSNSVSDEKAWLWLAENLTPGEATPEDTEELKIKRIPVDEAIGMVHAGEIQDAMSVIALLMLQNLLNSKTL